MKKEKMNKGRLVQTAGCLIWLIVLLTRDMEIMADCLEGVLTGIALAGMVMGLFWDYFEENLCNAKKKLFQKFLKMNRG